MNDFERSQDVWNGLMDSFDEQPDQTTELGPYTIQLADDDIRQLNESCEAHMEVFNEDVLDAEEEDVTLQVVDELLRADFEQSSVLQRGDMVCIAGEALVLSANPVSADVSTACLVARGGRVIGRLADVSLGESPLEAYFARMVSGEIDNDGTVREGSDNDIPSELKAVLILEDAHYEEADDDRGSTVYRDSLFPEESVIFVPAHYRGLVVAKVLNERVMEA